MTGLYGYHQARTLAYRALNEHYGWLDDHRPYRAWEWPHALMALDVLPEHEVLSIGAMGCGVTVALAGQVQYLHAIDLDSQFEAWAIEHFGAVPGAKKSEGVTGRFDYGLRNGLAVSADYSRTDARDIPWADACFDRILCVSVLEHVREEADGDILVAQEIGRLLRPGGIAVVTLEVAQEWHSWAPPVGRLYSLPKIVQRVCVPSGLELLNPEGLDWNAGDWDHIWDDIPRRGLPDLIPACLALRKAA